jgi:hypothetical protein
MFVGYRGGQTSCGTGYDEPRPSIDISHNGYLALDTTPPQDLRLNPRPSRNPTSTMQTDMSNMTGTVLWKLHCHAGSIVLEDVPWSTNSAQCNEYDQWLSRYAGCENGFQVAWIRVASTR